MPRYADGYVLPIPKRNLAAYRRMARLASRVWMDHGALQYVESVLEDGRTPCGLPFTKLAKCRKGETVVLAWIVYRSRAHRDRVNGKVMTDPRIGRMMKGKPPFDMARMAFSGFEFLVGR